MSGPRAEAAIAPGAAPGAAPRAVLPPKAEQPAGVALSRPATAAAAPRRGDLRLRLAATLVAVLLVSQLARLAPAAAALAGAAALALGTGRVAARRLLHLEAVLILLFLSLPLTMPGRTILSIGPLGLSAEGLTRAATLAARIGATVLMLTWALEREPPARIGAALRGLRLPEALVRLFLATAHYLDLTRAEALRLREAMRARAFRARSSRHSWRSLGHLIGMLILRALARADRVEEAMRARGYAGQMPRRPMPPPARADWLQAAALVTAAAALFLWDHHA